MIGSGATAATLIPAIADECAHVTMLQRSPTYFRTGRNAIEIAETLRAAPGRRGMDPRDHAPQDPVRSGRLHPQDVRGARGGQEGFAVGGRAPISARITTSRPHFTPRYRPWRQRIAFIPDGDLFQGIKSGKASVVTDEIDRFTETGILLKSGKALEADIIVTATGFNLSATRRHRIRDRRQAARFRRHRDLSRHDVHRRAEPGLGVRLFPGELDAARRSGRRLRLPAAHAHEEDRREEGDAGAAAGRPATCRCCPGSIRRISTPAT